MWDDLISLAEAACHYPGKANPSTAWRHCRYGVKARNGERVRLKHHRIGGRIYTTVRWLRAFFQALVDADLEHFHGVTAKPSKIHSRRDRETRIERAERELEREGF